MNDNKYGGYILPIPKKTPQRPTPLTAESKTQAVNVRELTVEEQRLNLESMAKMVFGTTAICMFGPDTPLPCIQICAYDFGINGRRCYFIQHQEAYEMTKDFLERLCKKK